MGALYPVYLRPVRSGVAGASETTKLHALFKNNLLAAKAAFDSGSGWKGVLASVVASDAAGCLSSPIDSPLLQFQIACQHMALSWAYSIEIHTSQNTRALHCIPFIGHL